jgi:AcrR family transcriptional regulator
MKRDAKRSASRSAKAAKAAKPPKAPKLPKAATAPRPRRDPARARPAPEPPANRAPGRGKYDRSATPDARQRDQMNRLLDAAGHVFAERGWAGATVEAIVTRAGMSRRTFYEHFEDLRECLLVFHQKVARASFRAVEAQVQAATDTQDMLKNGVTALLGGIAAFPHVARVMFREVRAAGPAFEKIHEQMMSRFAKLVFDGVERAHDQGRTELPADELRVFALVSAMEAVGMRYVLRGEESKALEAAPVLIDMVQRAFGTLPDYRIA